MAHLKWLKKLPLCHCKFSWKEGMWCIVVKTASEKKAESVSMMCIYIYFAKFLTNMVFRITKKILTLMELRNGASNSPSALYLVARSFMSSISNKTSLSLSSLHSITSCKISTVLSFTSYCGIGSSPYIFFSHKVTCQRRETREQAIMWIDRK